MEKEIKREARKQFLKYFRIWFVVIGMLAVIFAIVFCMHALASKKTRGNNEAPAERVYDNADVLTQEEEEELRKYIAECEAKYHLDFVLVTINQDVESQGDWETVMMNFADDFYDNNKYGYNKVHGDGVLLLDNWYEDEYGSQAGSWLSTCGSAFDEMGNYEINQVLDAVYYKVEDNPYAAYRSYVKTTCEIMNEGVADLSLPWWMLPFGPLVIALIYAISHLVQSKAKDTTTAKTYVKGGTYTVTASSDDFIRKNVVTRRIESSSGGSHSGGRSGGGGSHRSSGGVRHGGGGRRR